MKKLLPLILILALVSCALGCKRAALAEEAEVIFGSYEQDSNPANGSEPIEWIILRANADGSRVLMSKYALDCLPYHSSYAEVSWETSEIRKWLNGYFYSEAFSEDEKNQILGMRLENKNNPSTGAKGGNDTEDSVYLLSAEEAAAYFAGRIEMACVPTEYAISKGADNGGGTCWWWLRSVGGSEFYAAYVDKDGSVIDYGDAVTYSTFAVRPVITVKAADTDWKVKSGEESGCAKYTAGDIITFGRYEQDNDTSNGTEPIEWIILDVNEDGSLILISKYALDCKRYNTTYADVTWDTSTLRKWLNEDFFNAAFGAEEQGKIKTVHLVNEDNPNYGTKGGKDTDDRVWLLSINEVTDFYKFDSHFTDDSSYICFSTAYAEERGVYTHNGACWWWLRSPGLGSRRAVGVDSDGNIRSYGYHVLSGYGGVRPVVCVLL